MYIGIFRRVLDVQVYVSTKTFGHMFRCIYYVNMYMHAQTVYIQRRLLYHVFEKCLCICESMYTTTLAIPCLGVMYMHMCMYEDTYIVFVFVYVCIIVCA
jgi:hypothetical protein